LTDLTTVLQQAGGGVAPAARSKTGQANACPFFVDGASICPVGAAPLRRMLGVACNVGTNPLSRVLQAWPVGDRPSSPSPAGRLVHSEIARRLAAGGISPVSRAFLFGTQQRRSDVARVVASICLWTCPRLKPTQARRRRYLVVSGGSKGRHSRTATEVHMGTPPDPKHNGGHEIMLTRSRSAS
jgi:hypothetical protein